MYGSVGFLMNYNIIDTVILRLDFSFLISMNMSNDIHIAVPDGNVWRTDVMRESLEQTLESVWKLRRRIGKLSMV